MKDQEQRRKEYFLYCVSPEELVDLNICIQVKLVASEEGHPMQKEHMSKSKVVGKGRS